MRIHDHFHKLAILYVSELLFSFIFCPLTFVFLQAMFFSYKAALIMFGVISTLILLLFIFVIGDLYCLLNQELYGMLKSFFYFM